MMLYSELPQVLKDEVVLAKSMMNETSSDEVVVTPAPWATEAPLDVYAQVTVGTCTIDLYERIDLTWKHRIYPT